MPQGDSLSPVMFTVYLEAAPQDSRSRHYLMISPGLSGSGTSITPSDAPSNRRQPTAGRRAGQRRLPTRPPTDASLPLDVGLDNVAFRRAHQPTPAYRWTSGWTTSPSDAPTNRRQPTAGRRTGQRRLPTRPPIDASLRWTSSWTTSPSDAPTNRRQPTAGRRAGQRRLPTRPPIDASLSLDVELDNVAFRRAHQPTPAYRWKSGGTT